MKDAIRFLFRIIFKIFYRVEVVNREAVPQKGPVILCANHLGALDMFFIGFKIKRLVHYMAKEELFKIPVIAPIIRYLGAFPVKRGKADLESIKTALRLLKEGHVVGILPEGTRTMKKDIKTIRAKPGVALLAIKSGVPVLPVALCGNYKLFSKVRVVFGEPFMLEADRNKRYSGAELSGMSAGIMEKVYALMKEV